jgi:hypothetical protein
MIGSLIGIIASSGGAAAAANSYESIATVTVGSGGSSSVTFSSIPSTYQHLQIRAIGHYQGTASAYQNLQMQFNSDTGSNYVYHRLYGNGSSASADASASTTKINTPWIPDDTYTSNYGAQIIDILDYASVSKNKTIRVLGGFDGNGSGFLGLFSGAWLNSSTAISSVSIFIPLNTISQYSSFALYGIKG